MSATACDCAAKRIPKQADAAQRQALALAQWQAKEWAGRTIHEPTCASVKDIARGGAGVARVITPAMSDER